MRHTSRILTAACAVTLVAGLGAVSGFSATNPTHKSAAFRAAALKAFEAQMSQRSAPNRAAHGTVPRLDRNVSSVGSFNWAGYVDTSTKNGAFTSVSANFVVPKLTCTAEDRIVSIWVGLDGFTDGTVEQDGASGQCFGGTALYYTWYEMFPAGTVVIGSGTVKAGDHIAASVNRSSTNYTLAVTDSTTSGNSGTTTQSCAAATCLAKNAEWVVERPAFSTTGIVPLAQFAKATLTAAKVSGGGKSGVISTFSPTDEITMIDSTQTYPLDTTSALNATGNSFSATWLNSY